jgi:hypothetical protein
VSLKAALSDGGEEVSAWADHLKRRAWLASQIDEYRPDIPTDARAAIAAWRTAEAEFPFMFLGPSGQMSGRTDRTAGDSPPPMPQ